MQPAFSEIDRIIAAALEEDIGQGDVTANLLIPETSSATLSFVNREPLVSCGAHIVQQVFERVSPDVKTHIHVHDGGRYRSATHLIEVSGFARPILTAERVALNLYQRMCSIATLTAKYVDKVQGTGAVILDTRKTMPGLRVLDKYAVRAGGGKNHRMRLDDAILIKDNHISICGGVANALEKVRKGNTANLLPVEIECDTLEQVKEALGAGAKRILLDNMDISMLIEAVQMVGGKAELEASGNVNLDTVYAIAQTGVDYISIGRLTHSVDNVDIGLDAVID